MRKFREFIKRYTPQIVKRIYYYPKLRTWQHNGRPAPPPDLYKQEVVKKIAIDYKISTFIETGTYQGDMVAAVKRNFNRIISIELSTHLAQQAKRRFSNFRNVTIIQGDSSKILPIILEDISQPVIFWLDAHYSSGITAKGEQVTPILVELECILKHHIKNHIIIIDDFRLFGFDEGYPSFDRITNMVYSLRDDLNVDVKNDSIHITPNEKNNE